VAADYCCAVAAIANNNRSHMTLAKRE